MVHMVDGMWLIRRGCGVGDNNKHGDFRKASCYRLGLCTIQSHLGIILSNESRPLWHKSMNKSEQELDIVAASLDSGIMAGQCIAF